MHSHPAAKASFDAHASEPMNAGDTSLAGAQTGLTATVGGSAIAIGTSPLATGFVENFAQDKGNISLAIGEALFGASAYSDAKHQAFADASTFLDVSGADVIVERQSSHSNHTAHGASAVSELDYFAIDIHGWAPPGGPIVVDVHQPFHPHGQTAGLDPSYGNFAHVLATAEAAGMHTIASTVSDALSVENHFSFVMGMGLVAL